MNKEIRECLLWFVQNSESDCLKSNGFKMNDKP